MQDYKTAIEIFENSEVGKDSKEVAQLSAWMSLAYLALEKYEAAFDWNERAYKAARKVFGETSWQVQRGSAPRPHPLRTTSCGRGRKALCPATSSTTPEHRLQTSFSEAGMPALQSNLTCLHS